MWHSYNDHPHYLDSYFDAPLLPQRSSSVGCSSTLIGHVLKSRRHRIASIATATPTSPYNGYSNHHNRTLPDLLSLDSALTSFPCLHHPPRSCSLTAWWTAPSSPSESPTVPSFLSSPTSSTTTPTSPSTGLFSEATNQTEEICLRWPLEDTNEPEEPSNTSDTFFLDLLQRVRRGSAVGYERERVLKWFRRDWVERSLEHAMLMEDWDDEVGITVGHVGVRRPEVRWCEEVEGVVEECEVLSEDEGDRERAVDR